MGNRALVFLLHTFFFLLYMSTTSYGRESDIHCLRLIKESLRDPNHYLNSSWNFDNNTEGFICRFSGVECLNPDENRVVNLRLSYMGLEGQFPIGLVNCTSLTGLSLSNNNLIGPIPPNVSEIIPYVTTLDLSFNNFSGEIPVDISNLSDLNSLDLSFNNFTGEIPVDISNLINLNSLILEHNRLRGSIPWQFIRLKWLTRVNVADNKLTGTIPGFLSWTSSGNFVGNPNLCGKPLENECPRKANLSVAIGSAVGGFVGTLLIVGVISYCCFRRVSRNKEEVLVESKWAKRSIEGAKDMKVVMLVKSISKMRLFDLVKATDNFNKDNIIGSGRTWTTYQATLSDGSFVAVKRWQFLHHSEKRFVSEMLTLGSVKHRNLVPLLGFCVSRSERLLVYKYMPIGTLYHQLHVVESESSVMEWPLRLRIGIAAAKGLAWLHHNCNPRIIHRNISSKCILLDDDFEPKISDFGLAKLMNPDESHLSGFASSVIGELGYIAPEYRHTLLATPKGDVYSFGTVLLELVTGKYPNPQGDVAPGSCTGSLAEWVTDLSDNALLANAIDESLLGKGFDGEIFQVLQVACHCVLPNPKERPNMLEVCQLLRGIGKQYDFKDDVEEELWMPMVVDDVEELQISKRKVPEKTPQMKFYHHFGEFPSLLLKGAHAPSKRAAFSRLHTL